MVTLEIYSDGGSRGNPGPAAIGVVIRQVDVEVGKSSDLKEISEYIGETTNNQAEYQAVIHALEWVQENIKEEAEMHFQLDSQLVVEQLNGNYKLKNEGLKPLFGQIRDLIMALGGRVTFQYVPRAQNHHADSLVNKALDKHLKG